MTQVNDFLKRELFAVNGFHVTVGLVALVVLVIVVWKIARKS